MVEANQHKRTFDVDSGRAAGRVGEEVKRNRKKPQCRHPRAKQGRINDANTGLQTFCGLCGELLKLEPPLKQRPSFVGKDFR